MTSRIQSTAISRGSSQNYLLVMGLTMVLPQLIAAVLVWTNSPLAGIVAAVSLVAAVGGLFFVYRSLANLDRQLVDISDTLRSVVGGDETRRAVVMADDTSGFVAGQLNVLLDKGTVSAETANIDDLQDELQQLLADVDAISQGDLTVEVDATGEITAGVAGSLQRMVSQLRDIILNVQDTTLQVSSAANEIQTTAEHLALGSESQSSQILDTTAAIDEMAVSIQQVSENSTLSATISNQALASADKGFSAVNNSIEGMGRIRQQVQATSKRIKRLGESSQEIGEIVQLIRGIAKRTSILSLNAAIQAARAGEAGRSFAVVAEEVERLAERASEATKQISELTTTIQTEIAEAVAAMESTTQEVVIGTELNNEVSATFQEIQAVSNQLAEVIQSTSLAAQQQARGSETIARSMNEISEITQQTAAGTKEATVSIGNLARLADDLRGSISTFKLGNGYAG